MAQNMALQMESDYSIIESARIAGHQSMSLLYSKDEDFEAIDCDIANKDVSDKSHQPRDRKHRKSHKKPTAAKAQPSHQPSGMRGSAEHPFQLNGGLNIIARQIHRNLDSASVASLSRASPLLNANFAKYEADFQRRLKDKYSTPSYNIDSALGKIVQNPVGFREVLADAQGMMVGDFVNDFFDRTPELTRKLAIWVRDLPSLALIQHALIWRGYVPKRNGFANDRGTFYQQWKKTHKGEVVIELVMHRKPLTWLFEHQFNSTARCGYISGTHAVHMYPHLTFVQKRMATWEMPQKRQTQFAHKHRIEALGLMGRHGAWTARTTRDHVLDVRSKAVPYAQDRRSVYDHQSWMVEFAVPDSWASARADWLPPCLYSQWSIQKGRILLHFENTEQVVQSMKVKTEEDAVMEDPNLAISKAEKRRMRKLKKEKKERRVGEQPADSLPDWHYANRGQ